MLRDHVELEVHVVADASGAEVRAAERFRYQRGAERLRVGIDDRERNAVDGDRSFRYDEVRELAREAPAVVAAVDRDQLADAVDMSLHDVPAEAVAEAHRAFE